MFFNVHLPDLKTQLLKKPCKISLKMLFTNRYLVRCLLCIILTQTGTLICVSNYTDILHVSPVFWIHIHWIWIRILNFGLIWIRIQGYVINYDRKMRNYLRENPFSSQKIYIFLNTRNLWVVNNDTGRIFSRLSLWMVNLGL